MKKAMVLLSIALLAVAINMRDSGATPQIKELVIKGKKVHDAVKNGVKVNECAYCHSGAGIKMTKGQSFKRGGSDYKKLKTFPKCAFSGCHL